jgi:TonB family protein
VVSVFLLIMAASAGQAAVEYTAPREESDARSRLLRLYPSRALSDGQSAAALMDVDIDPQGQVTACRIVATYGNKSLGESICGLRKKVDLTPATIDGKPAYGSLRTFATFFIPGEKEGREVSRIQPVADVEFTVKTLPDGQESLRLPLKLLIAPDGALSECKGSDDKHPTFVGAACGQIAKVKFQPLKDAAGVPVQHVRGFTAEFNLAK